LTRIVEVKNYTSIYTRASFGLESPRVAVEVHLSNGLPALNIVGLANAEVKESKERVRSAIINSGFDFPARRITMNLAPADLPKSGGRYDLAIAVGILVASDQLPADHLVGAEFLAELGLNGETRPVKGVLASAIKAQQANTVLWIASANAEEASLSGHSQLVSVADLRTMANFAFAQQQTFIDIKPSPTKQFVGPCLSQVIGNDHAKRALLMAVVGGHNMLMIGTPGSGKTMLANCLPGLLPSLDAESAKEVAAIESLSEQGFNPENWRQVRVRQPHHSCSQVAMTGGGKTPRPGEISLAHQGVLFLDELPEFNRAVLESLRQPLEEGQLTVSRAEWKVNFPAKFQLLAAMNPCPCGYDSSHKISCRCSQTRKDHYLAKVSGPLLDRIDIQVQVNESDSNILDQVTDDDWVSANLLPLITGSRQQQIKRQGCLNNELSSDQLHRQKDMTKEAKKIFKLAVVKTNLSMRGQVRALRLALTISDWENSHRIDRQHISEALSYRALEIVQKDIRPVARPQATQ
jgi:magnesium chelatase family protein